LNFQLLKIDHFVSFFDIFRPDANKKSNKEPFMRIDIYVKERDFYWLSCKLMESHNFPELEQQKQVLAKPPSGTQTLSKILSLSKSS
jgi:hypothetical protein